jgi:hypothetical protein
MSSLYRTVATVVAACLAVSPIPTSKGLLMTSRRSLPLVSEKLDVALLRGSDRKSA